MKPARFLAAMKAALLVRRAHLALRRSARLTLARDRAQDEAAIFLAQAEALLPALARR